jgi:hypothetical protein
VRAALIALAAAGVLAAGCADRNSPAPSAGSGTTTGGSTTGGSPSGAATTTGAPSTTPSVGQSSPSATTTRCRTGDLAAALTRGDAGAGNRYASLVLTNTSRRTCTIFGYGGIQLADAGRHPIPTVQHRDPMHRPSLVRLAPGARASAPLHWSAIPHSGESMTGPCEPEPALLLVIPPDERAQLAVPWHFGSVCGHGTIDQWAYTAGVLT